MGRIKWANEPKVQVPRKYMRGASHEPHDIWGGGHYHHQLLLEIRTIMFKRTKEWGRNASPGFKRPGSAHCLPLGSCYAAGSPRCKGRDWLWDPTVGEQGAQPIVRTEVPGTGPWACRSSHFSQGIRSVSEEAIWDGPTPADITWRPVCPDGTPDPWNHEQ